MNIALINRKRILKFSPGINHAKNGQVDHCRYCGETIYYSADDGYWDSLEMELIENGKVHKYYTYLCDNSRYNTSHEPVNWKMNENKTEYISITDHDRY